jgi:hypothetical protein
MGTIFLHVISWVLLLHHFLLYDVVPQMGNNILPMVTPKNALFPPTSKTIISLNGIGWLALIIGVYVIILGSILVHIGTKGMYR